MIVAEYSENTQAPIQEIWNKWTDVSSWKQWNFNIEYSDLDGPFSEESTGLIKAFGNSTRGFMIKDIKPQRGFIDVCKIPLGELRCHHIIERVGENTKITQRVELSVPLASIIGLFLKPRLNHHLKATVKALKNIVEYETSRKK